MPLYTIVNRETEEEIEVQCTYDELQSRLEEDSNLFQKLSTPKLVSMVGHINSKTDDGFKDRLRTIKDGAGRGNTINI